RMLARIPNGTGKAVDVLEDDGFSENKRFEIRVSLQKHKEKLVVDCAGTSRQAMGPINQSKASSTGSIYAALLSLIDPGLALNEAIVDFADIPLPEGTLVTPKSRAPFSSYFHTRPRLAENVVRAIEPMRPDLVVAGSYGDAQNISGWG